MNTSQRIKQLADLPIDNDYVISLYLKLEEKDRENFKYKITLKNLIKKTKEHLEDYQLSREQLKYLDEDLSKIEKFFEETSNFDACKGIALFCSTPKSLWEFFKLPYTYRNRLVVDKHPLVGELLKIEKDYEPIPFLLIDRKKARLFNIHFDGAQEIHDYIYPGATRAHKFHSPEGRFKYKVSAGAPGNVTLGFGEHGFNRAVENEYHQHLKYVADRLFDYYKETKFDYFMLGGNEQSTKDFINHLHSYLVDKVLGTVTVDVDEVKESELIEHTLNALQNRKRNLHINIIKEFEEKTRQRLAISGIDAVIKALSIGQVKTLLLGEGYSHEGYICPESRILTLEKEEQFCPEAKTPLPVADIIDYMTEQAFEQQAEVVILDKDIAAKTFNNVGAILRFSL